ncbi:MAG: hypothetical protein HZA53_15215 [Planctomycetes bacterium]|nr:hypothetical protein [Planctomycetota bacterium]
MKIHGGTFDRYARALRSVVCCLSAVLFLAFSGHGQCRSWDPAIGQYSPQDPASALLTAPDGAGSSLYAGGGFYGLGPSHVQKWNGTVWTAIGTLGVLNDSVYALEMYGSGTGSQIYAGGALTLGTFAPQEGIARWTGTTWERVEYGIPGTVYAFDVFPPTGASVLIAGGLFGNAGGPGINYASRIAAWNGTSWSKLGVNTVGGGFPDGVVLALTVWDSGQGPELYAGGTFTMADGVPAAGIARWNGTSWSDVASHPPYAITDFAIFDDGAGPALYAAGGFRIWRFDGAAWTEIGCLPNGGISKLAVFDDGDGPAIFVGGYFTQIGGIGASHLARFDGINWSPVGGGIPSHPPALNGQIDALGVYDNGTRSELVVSGLFDSVGAISARYFTAWRACSSPIDTLCFGDGTTRACPCGNQGALGHGCAWHNRPAGAELTASGSPASDDVLLTASGMPLSAPSTVFLKGDQLLDTPTTFGDGLRCVSGTLIRLGTKTNVNGAAQYPTAGNASVSTRGGTPPGSGMIGYYQTWYRNAAVFCAPETHNVTNGVRIVW